MGTLIRVQAKRELRRELARWARGIRGVRMVSSVELGFPPAVFPDIPERLLVDSMIDGRPYHLARHVPLSRAPRPRSRTVRASAPAPTKPKGTPDATPTRDRVEDARGDAVAPPAVADKARVATAGGPAIPDPSAEVIPAEETTAAVAEPAEVTATDPLARPREGTHYAGDGCQPPHTEPDPALVEAAATVDGEYIAEAAEMAGVPGPALNLETGVETAAGEPLPEVPEPAYPPDTVPLNPAPAQDEADEAAAGAPATGHPVGRRQQRRAVRRGTQVQCPEPGCSFATSNDRGMAIHRGRAHPAGSGEGGGSG